MKAVWLDLCVQLERIKPLIEHAQLVYRNATSNVDRNMVLHIVTCLLETRAIINSGLHALTDKIDLYQHGDGENSD